MIFDDVEVPKDRVFIDANLAAYNTVMRTSLVAQHHAADDDPGADQAGVRLGLANRMPKASTASSRPPRQMLGEIWTLLGVRPRRRSTRRRCRRRSTATASGSRTCGPLHALRATLPYWFPRVNEIIRLLGSHNVFAAPTQAQMRDPELKPLIDRYLRGARRRERRGARAGLPAGLGLRRQRARQPQRAVRALLPRLRRPQSADPRDSFFDPSRADRLVDQIP